MELSELSPTDFVRYQAHKGLEESLRSQAEKLLRRAAIEEQLAELVLRDYEG